MKKYLVLAVSSLALASCQSDDFVGNNPGSPEQPSSASIQFDGNANKITRATSNTGNTETMLAYQFKVYGMKSGETAGTDLKDVFKNYWVWNTIDPGVSATKNNGWEYVGKIGDVMGSKTDLGNLDKDQTAKYWDYSAAEYRFVAGSPVSAFTFVKDTDGNIEKANVTGLGGHINANPTGTKLVSNPVYVANPVIVSKEDYKKPVKFTFVRQQTQVRVGVYENIPGYSVSEIHFYKTNDDGDLEVETGNNIILTNATANYFVGGNNVSGTITYDWTNKTTKLDYDETNLTKSKNWYGGELANGLSNLEASFGGQGSLEGIFGEDKDMSTTGYFTVMPTPAALDASPILIKCDYTLTADDNSGETIKVKGATAAIPAVFSKWNANTLYTYIFKISANTNGATGGDSDPKGLYPISFDAAVADASDGTQGTVTSFTAPSITTIQEKSSESDIAEGIMYAPNLPIYATVANAETGEAIDVTVGTTKENDVQVYTTNNNLVYEADLQTQSVVDKYIIDDNKVETTLEEHNGKHGIKFTPTQRSYYIIQYIGANGVKTYKVLLVGF